MPYPSEEMFISDSIPAGTYSTQNGFPLMLSAPIRHKALVPQFNGIDSTHFPVYLQYTVSRFIAGALIDETHLTPSQYHFKDPVL